MKREASESIQGVRVTVLIPTEEHRAILDRVADRTRAEHRAISISEEVRGLVRAGLEAQGPGRAA